MRNSSFAELILDLLMLGAFSCSILLKFRAFLLLLFGNLHNSLVMEVPVVNYER